MTNVLIIALWAFGLMSLGAIIGGFSAAWYLRRHYDQEREQRTLDEAYDVPRWQGRQK